MALLQAYGFDIYANGTEFAATEPNWSNPGGGLFSTTNGRFSGGALNCGPNAINNDDEWDLAVDNMPLIFYGFSFIIAASEEENWSEFLRFMEGGTVNAELRMNNVTHLADVLRGTTVIGSFNLPWYIWHRIEVKLIVHNSAGEITVRLNEQQVFSATGIDTQFSTNAWTDNVRFREKANGNHGATLRFDDVTVVDDSGPAPQNTWLGDLRIETLIPDADGSSSDFTPLASTNVSQVDEVPGADGDTSYVSSATATDQDLFDITALQGTQNTIYALKVTANANKQDANGRQIQLLALENITTGNGASQQLTNGTYLNFHEFFPLNPDTSSAWSTAEIAATEIGMELV